MIGEAPTRCPLHATRTNPQDRYTEGFGHPAAAPRIARDLELDAAQSLDQSRYDYRMARVRKKPPGGILSCGRRLSVGQSCSLSRNDP